MEDTSDAYRGLFFLRGSSGNHHLRPVVWLHGMHQAGKLANVNVMKRLKVDILRFERG